jgi:hypothetical protein
MVIPALEGQKFMDGSDGGGVLGMDSKPAATRDRIHSVGDKESARGHDRGPRHLTIVDKPWKGKVPPREGAGNGLHVATYLGGSGRVGTVPLEGNAATVRQRLEAM